MPGKGPRSVYCSAEGNVPLPAPIPGTASRSGSPVDARRGMRGLQVGPSATRSRAPCGRGAWPRSCPWARPRSATNPRATTYWSRRRPPASLRSRSIKALLKPRVSWPSSVERCLGRPGRTFSTGSGRTRRSTCHAAAGVNSSSLPRRSEQNRRRDRLRTNSSLHSGRRPCFTRPSSGLDLSATRRRPYAPRARSRSLAAPAPAIPGR